MRVEEIRKLLTDRPFLPFDIHLAEGRHVNVHHHDFATISPGGRTMVAYGIDDSINIIDIMLVTSIEVGPPPKPAPTANGSVT